MQTEPVKRQFAKRVALMAVVLFVVGGPITFFFYRQRSNHTRPPVEEKLAVVRLEPFVLNLNDPGDHTYLRLGLDLAVASAAEPQKTEAKTSPSLIRDTVLDVLMSATSKDLESADQKRQLKQTILQTLNSRCPELKVREVYFTEFLIQR